MNPRPVLLRFLGEMVVERAGEPVALPPSKKTRALLAYLALTGREHRRSRLCGLLWDVTDDPRGALRWSLSKLRSVVNEPGGERIVADRESVRFVAADATVDVLEVRRRLAAGVETIETGALRTLAGWFRGELLEDLELGDFDDFQAWCIAERERAREHHIQILRALVGRLQSDPGQALPYARTLVHADPLDESARIDLVRLLVAEGSPAEAEQQMHAARRLFGELGKAPPRALEEAWRTLARPSVSAAPVVEATQVPPASSAAARPAQPPRPGQTFVGRTAQWQHLLDTFSRVREERRETVALVSGDPGAGKSRLVAEFLHHARAAGATVLEGRAYEVESDRPYGPWIDALRVIPRAAMENLGDALAPLFPELSRASAPERTRDRLFDAVVELLAAQCESAPPVVLALDDVQWLDESSSTLLHYVARTHRQQPILVLLAARSGELPDNPTLVRTLRTLRRERILDELELGPLDRQYTAALARVVNPEADLERIWAESGGNPLFVVELARAMVGRPGDLPAGLTELVRDRVDRLPPEIGDVLRWGAVLGPTFDLARLEQLTSSSGEALVDAIEVLERHALIRPLDPEAQKGTYGFTHDLLHRVVYADLSGPRRRLMHSRVADVLDRLDDPDGTIAAAVAHHASMAGDALLATRACVVAGRRCLRLFANAQALTLTKRGARFAADVPEPSATELRVELMDVRLAARRPEDPEEVAREIELLAQRALDQGSTHHARMAFHMLSYLRWEEGAWSDAQRYMMHAERVSRGATEEERVVALAEAARCLVMIERDLGQAEALLLEAGALSDRLGITPAAIPDGIGMLRLHRGELEEATQLFEQARLLSRAEHDRTGEYNALEHLVCLCLERKSFDEASRLCSELVDLSEKLRHGAEAPFARVLSVLARHGAGEGATEELDGALQALRAVDAKHRLAFALTRAAEIDLALGELERARNRASEALSNALLIERPSEIALARVVLGRVASAHGRVDDLREQIAALRELSSSGLSAAARREISALLETVEQQDTTTGASWPS